MSPALRAVRYGSVAIVLHWTMAALILVQLALGLRMCGAHTPQEFAVFQLHKSVGITILALSLLRLAWRLAKPPPAEPAALPAWQRRLAGAVHAGFYLVMIGMPLSGWLMVSTSRLRLPTLLYGRIPWPDLPGFAQLSDAARETWRGAGAGGHLALAWLFGLLFLLHVAGALSHQLSGDAPVLGRMLPGARPRRRLEPRLALVAGGLVLALAAGALVAPAPVALPAAPVTRAAPVASGPLPIQTAETPAAWRVLPGSRLGFATAWGGQAIAGRFAHWSGDIVFSPHALARSHIRVEVELASVSTDNVQRDAMLPNADWLDAARQPRAVFVSDRIQPLGGDRFLAHGALSLRGVTRPLDLAFTVAIVGDTAQATADARIDRTAFGVGQGEFARTDQVPAAVAVVATLKARREKSIGPVGAPPAGSS